MKRSWSQFKDEQFGQLGIIESISLRNFMCHDNLSFDFDPHMNFIVGCNGSGKSAVLTGIILALGGKSGATGRYSNIKGFVKTGKNSASVSVTLKNCGPDAYKPNDYGEKITVERHFTSEGVSSYKLKSESGRIVSNSKEELTNILNVMDIQIENPITVLTQEISRNFLLSKNSKGDKLFQLFYRGTGLAKVHENYNRAVQNKEEAKSELDNKKAVLPEMEKDVKNLKALLEKSTKVAELRKELCWAMVIEFEKKRDVEKETLEKMKNDFAILNRKLNLFEDELGNVCQSVPAGQSDKKASFEKMEAIRKDILEATNQRSSLKSDIREVQGTYSRYEREVKKFESEISSLENIMNEIRTKNQKSFNEGKMKHEQEMKKLQDQVTNATAILDIMGKKKFTLHEEYADIQKKMDSCHAEIQEVNYEMNRITAEKQQLIDGMKNRLNVFGPEMINVLREISVRVRSGAFKVEPKGPMGLYVNVKQSEWYFAIQECLKSSLLKTFLCDNHADAEQLTRIFNKFSFRQRPSIIITKFVSEVYDVTAHKTLCKYPTVLDMLEIEDPVIANCLIDQKQVENILLIADPKEAVKVMLYSPPDKCLCAYTVNGDQLCHSPFRKYSCRNTNQICILKMVNEDDVRKKDDEIKSLNTTRSAKKDVKENLMQQLQRNKRGIEDINNKITDLKLSINRLQMNVKDEESSYSEPKDINCLQSDLEHLQREKSHHEEKFITCRETVTSKKEELDILEKKLEECRRILQGESRNFHHLSEKVDEYENKKEKLDSAIKKIKSELVQIEPVLQDKERSLKDSNATVQVATDRAIRACPRIDTTRSSEMLKEILKETERYIQQQKNCNRDALVKEYEEKIENLNKAKFELGKQEGIHAHLEAMMIKRFQEFEKICKNTSVSLTCAFTTLLKENNFSGYPEISFDSKTLEIFAKPEKIVAKLGNKSNLSQLSGGERSYVTIAFLLSLWDRIHMPFRILDEYDVFMDSNNRHLSIHLLINTAKSNKKIQYIFLSPLELPQIEDSAHVKVHEMPAPRK